MSLNFSVFRTTVNINYPDFHNNGVLGRVSAVLICCYKSCQVQRLVL